MNDATSLQLMAFAKVEVEARMNLMNYRILVAQVNEPPLKFQNHRSSLSNRFLSEFSKSKQKLSERHEYKGT